MKIILASKSERRISMLRKKGYKFRSVGADVSEKTHFKQTAKIVKDLAQARRNVLAFRAMMDPQRSVFKRIVILKKDYLSTDLANYFDDINDFIGRIYTNLTNLKELISGLHETNESLSSYRLNKVMKVLAIFSVAMLPLTLLTGIYGMNLSNLPLIHNESLVWYIFGGVAIIIIALFAYFKHKDII